MPLPEFFLRAQQLRLDQGKPIGDPPNASKGREKEATAPQNEKKVVKGPSSSRRPGSQPPVPVEQIAKDMFKD